MRAHTNSTLRLLSALSVVIAHGLIAETYVFDFSTGDSASIVLESDADARDLGIEFKHALPSGTYEIVLVGNSRFIIPVDRGRLRVENENKAEISKIELITPIFSINETFAITEAFHNAFDLPLDNFYAWAQPAKEGKFPRDFYGKTFKSNYPSIGMTVHSSYNKDIPFFVTYHFNWDNWLHERRGTSAESNTLQDFTFDIPKIVESVKAEASEPPIVEDSEPVAKSEEIYEEEPVEAVFDEVEKTKASEEPTEQSSNWWLWLIGAVVVVGGIGLALRRKS
jgi:hypothetical protein